MEIVPYQLVVPIICHLCYSAITIAMQHVLLYISCCVFLMYVTFDEREFPLSLFIKDYHGEGHSNESIGQFLGRLASVGKA